jgi:ATP-dependent Clp protease, protease subunit
MMNISNNLQFGRKAPLAQRLASPAAANIAPKAVQPRFGNLFMSCNREYLKRAEATGEASKALSERPRDVCAQMIGEARMVAGVPTGDPVARALLKNNFIPIDGMISPTMATETQNRAMLLVAAMKQLKECTPIRFMINSPGGYIVGMNGILSTMNLLKKAKIRLENGVEKPIPVETFVNGYAASAATLIAANGTKGHRFITDISEYMIHQPLGGSQGQATQIQIDTELIRKYKNFMIKFFAERSNLSEEEIAKEIDRDNWKDADVAVKDGFLDHIATEFPELLLRDNELGAFSPHRDSSPFDDPSRQSDCPLTHEE